MKILQQNLSRPQRAFSLLEVVMALGLLSFCVVGLLGLMSAGLAGMRSAAEDSTLTVIAKKVAADIQQNPLDEILSQNFSDCWFNAEGQEVPASDPFVVYKAQARVVPDTALTPGSAQNSLGRITINVFQHSDSRPSVVWVSYVARN